MRIAVIGAGIIGASVARELARHGGDVTIFDQHHPGAGTSGTTFGWVNSHEKHPEAYHHLNARACLEHRRLARDPGSSPPWFFPTGNLEWASDRAGHEALHARVRRLHDLDYPTQWLDPATAAQLEPDIRIPPQADSIAFFPDEGFVSPQLLLARLLGEARELGAVLRYPATVSAVEPRSDRVDVRLEGGDGQAYDRAVSCAGRWTPQLSQTWGRAVPLADPDEAGGTAVGVLAYTSPVPARVSRVLTTPRINVRPDGGGRLVLQSLDLDHEADPAQPPDRTSPIATELSERLDEILPLGRPAMIESVRVGQRPLPVDGLTIAGFADDHERCYVAATHSGVTLGPLLGRLIASELLDTDRSAMLTNFRPSRFNDQGGEVTVAAARRPGEQ